MHKMYEYGSMTRSLSWRRILVVSVVLVWWNTVHITAFVWLHPTSRTNHKAPKVLLRTNDMDHRSTTRVSTGNPPTLTLLEETTIRDDSTTTTHDGSSTSVVSTSTTTTTSSLLAPPSSQTPPPPLPLMGVDLPYPNIINAHHPNGDVVSAILAASEEAVAVAEATLLLSSSSSLKDSYTDTTPNANTAVLPSVVVPKPTTTTTTTMDHQYSPFEEMDTADDDDEEEEDQVMMITAPSVRKIISFAIPAIGVWLCNPLLSLIDTSIVGIYSGTIQQAALNPAVAVTDYAALLMAFLYTGTTNLIAAAHTQDSKHHPNRMMMTTTTGVGTNVTTSSSRTTTTLIGVLKLSTYAGMALTTMLFVCANSLLRTLIGNDSIHPDVFHAAMKYVRIRALGMPAAAMIGSAQAACLGIQDIQSPLYVLVAAAVVNLVGDLIFVGSNHPWIGGAAGAAWATVFSQYAAATMFLYWLRHKKTIRPSPIRTKQDPYHHKKITDNDSSTGSSSSTVVNLSNAILEMTSSQSNKANVSRRQQFVDSVRSIIAPSSPITERTMNDSTRSVNRRRDMVASTGNKNVNSRSSSSPSHIPKATSAMTNKNISARGFLEGKLRKRDLIAFPNQDTLKQFAPYVIPVTTTVIGRLSGYIAMSHVVSSSFGTISMAAQQVIVSLFYCLCPIADSLSLTAQSFVPSISESTVATQRSQVMKQTAANFYKAGSISGAVIVAAVCCIPFLSGFFTADVNVIALVNMVVPYLIGFFAVHGFVCGVEGLLLGQKDLGFLGKMYGGFFFIVPALMLQVKRAALAAADSGAVINLTSVWKIMVGYQLFRSVAWSLRLSLLQRKTVSEGNLLTASVVAS